MSKYINGISKETLETKFTFKVRQNIAFECRKYYSFPCFEFIFTTIAYSRHFSQD